MDFTIREYRVGDIEAIVSLFYATVHTVNAQHYSAVQLEAWAAWDERGRRIEAWRAAFAANITLVAERGRELVGFADMTRAGFLERLYVHKNFQRQGIATALVDRLEAIAREMGATAVEVDASITAQPFFERRGYALIRRQEVERRGVLLPNCRLIKQLPFDG